MSSLPLAGRRVLVTRAAHQAGKLSEGLRALGAEPVEVPVLEIRPPSSFEPLDEALRQLDHYDWLILTSANTVRALVERAAELGIALAPASLKVAAVGEATADAARNVGFLSRWFRNPMLRKLGGGLGRPDLPESKDSSGAGGCGTGCDSRCAAAG